MKRNLFLTGSKAVENSNLLRSVLGDRLAFAGGYLTMRTDLSEDNYEYWLYPACHGAGIEGMTGEKFFQFSYTELEKDTEVFRSNGTQLLQEAVYYPYAVLDHFGGFEILVPQFRSALSDLLNSEVPVIGVLLQPEDVLDVKLLYGLGDKLDLLLENLHNVLKKDIDSEVVDTDSLSHTQLEDLIRSWVDSFAVMG